MKAKKKSKFQEGKELGLDLALYFLSTKVGASETVLSIIDRFRKFFEEEKRVNK